MLGLVFGVLGVVFALYKRKGKYSALAVTGLIISMVGSGILLMRFMHWIITLAKASNGIIY